MPADCRSDELALNGVLVVLVARVFTDFVVAPRLTRAKRCAVAAYTCPPHLYCDLTQTHRHPVLYRYTLCPWIDMINHDGARGGSDVAYEYFTDSFVATLDGAAGETRAGEQVLISYGALLPSVVSHPFP